VSGNCLYKKAVSLPHAVYDDLHKTGTSLVEILNFSVVQPSWVGHSVA
jgi:hypothetical protein